MGHGNAKLRNQAPISNRPSHVQVNVTTAAVSNSQYKFLSSAFLNVKFPKPRIPTELVVMTNPSTLTENDDLLITKIYPIPHFFVFQVLFCCVFGIFRRVELWVDQSLDTITPWPCQAVVDTFVRLGFPGSRRISKCDR